MSLGPAKVRVEIFREPGFIDDSFAKGWTKTSVGTSSVSSDGDVVTLNGGDQLQCRFDKDIGPLALATYVRLICRVISVDSGEAQIDLFVDGDWVTVLEETESGVYEVLISGAGTTATKIRLIAESLGGAVASFDYVAICKNVLLVPDVGDLVEELTITRPLLNSAIAGAKLSIPNFVGIREYPTCSWWPTGTWLPETYSTQNLMSQSWKNDESWNYYMALIDSWTTQNENGNALYDFGSPKDATYHVRWKGILTPHTATASGRVECKIYAGLTSVVSEMTLVKQHTLTSPIGGPSVTFDIETFSFSGNYRYIFIYFTTFGDFSGQTYIVVLPTKLWVNGVWRDS